MAEWYTKEGKDNDVVLSTKACIVRNIKGYNFMPRLDDKECQSLLEAVDKAVDKSIYNGGNASGFDKETTLRLTRLQVLGREPNQSVISERHAFYYNDDASLTVSAGCGEHLTVKLLQTVPLDDVLQGCGIRLTGSIARTLQFCCPALVVIGGKPETTCIAAVVPQKQRMMLIGVTHAGIAAEFLIGLVIGIDEVTATGSEPVFGGLDAEMVIAFARQFAAAAGTFKDALRKRNGGRNAVLQHLLLSKGCIFLYVFTILHRSCTFVYIRGYCISDSRK